MAERMKSDEYTERRITFQKTGGKYSKTGCISKDQYTEQIGSFQRYNNIMNKNSISEIDVHRNEDNGLEHQVSFAAGGPFNNVVSN